VPVRCTVGWQDIIIIHELCYNWHYYLGIRILLFVNTSEFMATSESAGVRIAIHSKSEYPFPDTFGYSAPTGFASSFGIKKVRYLIVYSSILK
jgi:hypothetical protein